MKTAFQSKSKLLESLDSLHLINYTLDSLHLIQNRIDLNNRLISGTEILCSSNEKLKCSNISNCNFKLQQERIFGVAVVRASAFHL